MNVSLLVLTDAEPEVPASGQMVDCRRVGAGAHWLCQVPTAEALTSFLEGRGETRRVVVHRAVADDIEASFLAALLTRCPPGGVLYTEAAAPPDAVDLGAARVLGQRGRARVLGMDGSAVLPDLPLADRHAANKDAESLDRMRQLGMRIITVVGPPTAEKQALLRDYAWRMHEAGGRVAWVAPLEDTGEGLLCELAHVLEVAIDTRHSLSRTLNRLHAALAQSSFDTVCIGQVDTSSSLLRQLIGGAPSQTWITSHHERLGISTEVVYRLQTIDEQLVAPARWNELVEGVRSHVHPVRLFEFLEVGRSDVQGLLDLVSPEVRRSFLQRGLWPMLGSVGPSLGDVFHQPGVLEALERDGETFLALESEALVFMTRRCSALLAALYTTRAEEVLGVLARESDAMRDMVHGVMERRRHTAQDLGAVSILLEGLAASGVASGRVKTLLPLLDRSLKAAGASFDLEPVHVVRLFRTRGRAYLFLKRSEDATADLERARSVAERARLNVEVALADRWLAEIAVRSGRWDLARTAVERGLVALGDGHRQMRGELLAQRGTGRPPSEGTLAIQDLEQAIEHLEEGPPELRAGAWAELAVVFRREGSPERAVRSYRQAIDIWRRLGAVERLAAAQFQVGSLLQGIGAFDSALDSYREVDAIAYRCGDIARRGLIAVQIAGIELERGAIDASQKTLNQALSWGRMGSDRGVQGAAKGLLALHDHLKRNHAAASEGYREALQDLEAGSDHRFGAIFQALLGVASAELGQWSDARILMDMASVESRRAGREQAAAIDVLRSILERGERVESPAGPVGRLSPEVCQLVLSEMDALEDANIYLRFVRRYVVGLAGDAR